MCTGALVVEEGQVEGCSCKGEAGEEGGCETHFLGGMRRGWDA